MDDDELRRRVHQASPEVLLLAGHAAPHRAVARFGSVVAADLGVPFPWGVRAHPGAAGADAADASAALEWCRTRGEGNDWSVCVPASLPVPEPWRPLRVRDELPTFALPTDDLRSQDVVLPDEVTLSTSPSHREVAAAYGGWMDDDDLAHQLVVAGDLALRERAFVVAFRQHEPIGCAFVWWAAGTAYLSGVGVVLEHRGRGVGRALTTAATRSAVVDAPLRLRPDVVWMHATDEGARLYQRLGFRRIDTELHLGA